MLHDMQPGQGIKKYLLVAAKQGQDGATVDVEIQAVTVDTHVL
jgi:hypothetical protein